MIPEEKIKEVKKLLRKGVPEGELIADLKEQGYSDQEIQKVFGNKKQDNEAPIASERTLWNLISVGFMILGLTLLLGPPLWLRQSGYFFLIAGLVGIAVKLLRNRS